MVDHGLVSETAHRPSWPGFARHFLEMVAAMWVGMAVGRGGRGPDPRHDGDDPR